MDLNWVRGCQGSSRNQPVERYFDAVADGRDVASRRRVIMEKVIFVSHTFLCKCWLSSNGDRLVSSHFLYGQ